MTTSGLFSPTEVLRRVGSGTWVSPIVFNYAVEVLADSPAVYWKLDDAGSQAADSSGNGRIATIYNATSTTGFSAELGNARSFNGTNTYVQGSFNTQYNSAVTLEAVIRPGTQTDGAGVIISKNTYYADNYSNFPVALSVSNTNVLTFAMSAGDDYTAERVFTSQLTANTWYHVVGVFAQFGTSALYVNGVSVGSAATNFGLSASTNAWTVGRHSVEYSSGANDSSFVGLIQHAAIYPSALSAARVAAHYAKLVD